MTIAINDMFHEERRIDINLLITKGEQVFFKLIHKTIDNEWGDTGYRTRLQLWANSYDLETTRKTGCESPIFLELDETDYEEKVIEEQVGIPLTLENAKKLRDVLTEAIEYLEEDQMK